MRKYWWVILIICLLILIAICAVYLWVALKYQKDQKSLQDELKAAQSQIAARSVTPIPSASATATETASASSHETGIASAKAVVEKFLEAKQTRLLANAKPYMTESFYSSFTQEGFAGTSSPSMGRFEIVSAEFVEAAGLYEVKAKLYLNLNGEETGSSDNSYMVVDEDGTFLVNEMKGESF